MSQLAEFQREMCASLRNSSAPCPDLVVQQGPDQQSQRFNVYRNNRAVSLIDNLQATYPTVCKLVGEEFFRAVARLYIEQQPPVSPVMAEYGANFGLFLSGLPNARRIPYVADIASLEWARLCSYHAANSTSIPADVLSSIAPELLESLCFSAHPSLFTLSSRWPIGSVWAAIAESLDNPAVDMNASEEVVVVRPVFEVNVHILPANGAMLLRQLQQGIPLLAAVESVTQRHPGFDPGAHLQGLFALGVFSSTYKQG